MSKTVGLAKNAKSRKALRESANGLWQELLVAANPHDEEKLAKISFDDIRSLVDQLEDHKRRMRELLDEYRELSAL